MQVDQEVDVYISVPLHDVSLPELWHLLSDYDTFLTMAIMRIWWHIKTMSSGLFQSQIV